MNRIAEVSVVTVYSDLMAFVLTLGLSYMFRRYRMWKDKVGDSIFHTLCILVMMNAVFNGLSYALHYQNLAWPNPLKRLLPSLAEFSTLVLLYVWLIYVDYKLYRSRDRAKRYRKIFHVPVLVMGVLCLINLFTGFMFSMDENMVFTPTPFFYVLTVMQYVYGVLPVIAILFYIKRHRRLRFFHILPVAGPVIVSSLFTQFSDYSARAFGFAVALVFLHCSYGNLFRFCDRESGFYNRDYYEQMGAKIPQKLIFEVEHPNPAFYEILRTELPKNADIFRLDKKTFLLPMENKNASMVRLLSSMVKEDVEEYEENHPGEPPVGLTVRIE